MHPLITSLQNPKIKFIQSLEKSRERRESQLFLLEGLKELSLAVEGEYEVESIFFCPEIIDQRAIERLVPDVSKLIPISRPAFEKVAYRESTGGIIAVLKQKELTLDNLTISKNPLLLIVEGVEKPGNLGAILRTADAAGVDAVIVCDPLTDFYNPNVIRSSVGCVFTNQLASASSEETIAWLTKNNISIFCTYLKASKPYHEIDFTQPCAIIMGTEATGLSEQWVSRSNQNIIIPMQGKIDSLNVSTATSVVIFEARRQRGFAG